MLPWKKPLFELQHRSEILGFAFFVDVFCILPWFVSPFRGMCLELFSAIGKGTFCKNISPWDVIVIGKQRFEIQISLTNPIQKGVFGTPSQEVFGVLQTPILPRSLED